MNDEMDFNDTAFVARVQAWAADRRTMDRAPGRLVGAVMDGVAAAPRRRPWLARLPLRGVAGYAALTAAITVGVTFGILLAGRLTPNVGDASPSPGGSAPASQEATATPEGSQGPLPSPAVLARLTDVPGQATVVGAFGDSVWVADSTNRLSELDPVTAEVVRFVDLPRRVVNLVVTADSVWAASDEGDLVTVARLNLDITEVATGPGHALAVGPASIWLGAEDQVVEVDLATTGVVRTLPVANRGASLGLAVDGPALWVASRTEIQRIDPESGAVTARIQGDATSLAAVDGTLWATRGTELLRIDPTRATVLEFIPGLRSSGPIAIEAGTLWISGGSGPSALEGWDLESGATRYVAEIPNGGSSLALTSDTIWIGSSEGAAAYRFRLP